MKRITTLFAILLTILVILANFGLGSLLFGFLDYVPGEDKTAHFILFGMMSYFLNTALYFEKLSIHPVSIMKGSFILIVIVTLEEMSQYFIPSRTFSWLDLSASYLGIYFFGYLSKTCLQIIPDRR